MLTFTSKPRGPRARRQPADGPGAGLAPLSALAPHAAAPLAAYSPPLAAVADPVDSELPDEAIARRGWHDSSNELKRGLDVTEDVPLDALPPELRAPFTARRR